VTNYGEITVTVNFDAVVSATSQEVERDSRIRCVSLSDAGVSDLSACFYLKHKVAAVGLKHKITKLADLCFK
jgi:hypothetical protein